MYLVTIQVPIYVHGGERLLATDWRRSLMLLRDSFDGRFGRIQVVAPSLEARGSNIDQSLEPMRDSDEIELYPSFRIDKSLPDFWRQDVRVWYRDIAALMPTADVVHGGFCDVYRPLDYIGFLSALRADKPTVFVQDTDQVQQEVELNRGAPLPRRMLGRSYAEIYERCVRFGVKYASLSLLKGRALHTRYGAFAKNAHNFHDTSYFAEEIVKKASLDQRIHSLLSEPRPMRLVYCGRLEKRKGVDHSIEAIARARAAGARVTFDIIGDGPERAALERQAAGLELGQAVRFLGRRLYGPGLLADLASYDGLLFTPLAEDTPRMIFDGYAAGLPLLAYGIEYVREREAEDGAARSVPVRDAAALGELLCSLDRDRNQLAKLAVRAHEAAHYHSADAWYRRRAEWTYEAAAKYRHTR
jgi:glycosyltransferase involved in cell wall biosynthesis